MIVNIYIELQKVQLNILLQNKLNFFFGMNIFKNIYKLIRNQHIQAYQDYYLKKIVSKLEENKFFLVDLLFFSPAKIL